MTSGAHNRVAITGIGMVTCLGTSTAECWGQMLDGQSGIRTIERFDASSCATRFGGELPGRYYEIEAESFTKRLFKQTVATTRLGLLCAREALQDSGFTLEGRDPYRCGVITGSAQPSYPDAGLLARIGQAPGIFAVIQQMPNAMSAWISITHGFQGPSYNVAAACAAGSCAIAAAYEYITSGRGDAALAVGADVPLSALTLAGFNAVSALSTRNECPARASRPFDRDRSGFVLADGGAAVMLERESAARARGARIYALLVGSAMTSEAYNIIAPKPQGREMARTMAMALEDAGIDPSAVQYVNAHGTATTQNDLDETLAIKSVFGDHARRLAVGSLKSMIGHCISGAGAVECAATALSLHHGVLPPTINLSTPDPDCDLDYVPNHMRTMPELAVAVSNSFGFGGHNATLVLARAES